MNYCNTNDNPFKSYGKLPNPFKSNDRDILNYPNESQEQHESDGFYELIIPTYDNLTQKLGGIIFNTTHFTYSVIDYTTEELEQIRINNIPSEVTPRQFKLALIINHNISPTDVEVLINSFAEPDRTMAMINWLDATMFIRTNTMVNQFAPYLGLTQTDLDNIFILGVTLE